MASLLSLIGFLKIWEASFQFCCAFFFCWLLYKMRRRFFLVAIEIMIFLGKIHMIFIFNIFAATSFYRVLRFQKGNIWSLLYVDRLLLDVFMVLEGFVSTERLTHQILVFESPLSYRIVIEGTFVILFV